MTVPLDIITDALEKLGVYSPGEPLSAADASRSLQMLSDLMDQWANDSIQLYFLQAIEASLMAGTSIYTVGQGGSISAGARPVKVVMGPGVASVTVVSTTTPVDSVSSIEWNAIYNTQDPPPVGIPTAMFYQSSFPLGLLSLVPVPSTGMTLTFSGYYGLVNYAANLTSPNVTLAPGQQVGLASNLAILLHSYFSIGTITQDLIAEAQQSKTTLTLTNRLSRAMSARNVQPQTPAAPRP
jgi:hypothetical protein